MKNASVSYLINLSFVFLLSLTNVSCQNKKNNSIVIQNTTLNKEKSVIITPFDSTLVTIFYQKSNW